MYYILWNINKEHSTYALFVPIILVHTKYHSKIILPTAESIYSNFSKMLFNHNFCEYKKTSSF